MEELVHNAMLHMIFGHQNRDEQVKQFMSLQDGAAKAKFILEFLKDGHMLPPASETFYPKNDATSLAARVEGNNFFLRDEDYVAALECYNRSICLATDNSEHLAIGYANRSAVYLKSGHYKFCLQNIEFALKNNYPEKLRPKLEERKKVCVELMNNREDSLEKLKKEKLEEKFSAKLSHPPNQRMPFMIDGLEYARSEQYGRHIRTKRDLFPGDIIITEKPFAKHIQAKAEYGRCANCLDQNYLNLFPCRCTRTMFCNEQCRQEAWKRFHKYECSIIDGILDNLCGLWMMDSPVRLTLLAFTMFDEPEKLQELVKNINVETESAFDLDYNELTEQAHFRTIYALETHESNQGFEDMFRDMHFCAIMWHFLINYTDLHLLLKTEAMKDFFLNMLIHFHYTSIIHKHKLGPSESDTNYGCGYFALSSLLNHSCAPNVFRLLADGDTIVVVVQRVIKAGEQLFAGYIEDDTHHLLNVKEERQKLLKRIYKFDCQCEACVHNYPLLTNLPVHARYRKNMEEHVRLGNNDKEYAKKKLTTYKTYLKDNNKKYPGFEICTMQTYLMKCFTIMMSDKPLKEQLKPLHK